MVESYIKENMLAIELYPFEGGLRKGGANIYLNERRQYLTALVGKNFTTDRSKRPRLIKHLVQLADEHSIGDQNFYIRSIFN